MYKAAYPVVFLTKVDFKLIAILYNNDHIKSQYLTV